MDYLSFNESGSGQQHMYAENATGPFSPTNAITVEALCILASDGENPTVLSLPSGAVWQAPFVSWRLGFYAATRRPEFKITMAGDFSATTARAKAPVSCGQLVHLAGTFDGEIVRLFLDGRLVAEVEKKGEMLQSREKMTMGARSSTDLGGFFIGKLTEMRVWSIARSSAEVDFWKDKKVPPDKGERSTNRIFNPSSLAVKLRLSHLGGRHDGEAAAEFRAGGSLAGRVAAAWGERVVGAGVLSTREAA